MQVLGAGQLRSHLVRELHLPSCHLAERFLHLGRYAPAVGPSVGGRHYVLDHLAHVARRFGAGLGHRPPHQLVELARRTARPGGSARSAAPRNPRPRRGPRAQPRGTPRPPRDDACARAAAPPARRASPSLSAFCSSESTSRSAATRSRSPAFMAEATSDLMRSAICKPFQCTQGSSGDQVVLVTFESPNGRSTSMPRRSATPAASRWAGITAPSGLSHSGMATSGRSAPGSRRRRSRALRGGLPRRRLRARRRPSAPGGANASIAVVGAEHGDRAVHEVRRRVRLGGDAGQLLHLQRRLERGGVVRAAADHRAALPARRDLDRRLDRLGELRGDRRRAPPAAPRAAATYRPAPPPAPRPRPATPCRSWSRRPSAPRRCRARSRARRRAPSATRRSLVIATVTWPCSAASATTAVTSGDAPDCEIPITSAPSSRGGVP